jgi:hypothetical protein
VLQADHPLPLPLAPPRGPIPRALPRPERYLRVRRTSNRGRSNDPPLIGAPRPPGAVHMHAVVLWGTWYIDRDRRTRGDGERTAWEDHDQKEEKERGRHTSGPRTGTWTSSCTPPDFACPRLFFLDRVQEGIRYAQVFYLFFPTVRRRHPRHANRGGRS